MKKIYYGSVLLVLLLLVGCLSPSISFTFVPQEIKIERGQTEVKDLQLKIKMSGFSAAYRLDKLVVELKDDKGEVLDTETEELNETIPVVAFVNPDPVDVPTINLESIEGLEYLYADEALYNEHLKGKVYTLEVTVTGTKTSTTSAKIKFI